MQNLTHATKGKTIVRKWHHIDLKDKILGRTSTSIANLLMGKSKAYFTKNLDCGDYVVVTNAALVKVTGNKEKGKIYTSYSGYPGGLKRKRLEELREKMPEEIIRHSVSGMLPKNKLRDSMLKRLFVFAGEEHKYQDKFNN